jgi:transcriptional regulator with XRE-family HTH domain
VYWEEKLRNDNFLAAHSYMEAQGINQTQLGKKLGVGRSRVSQILNGNYNPSMKKFIELCLALEKQPEINIGSKNTAKSSEILTSEPCQVFHLKHPFQSNKSDLSQKESDNLNSVEQNSSSESILRTRDIVHKFHSSAADEFSGEKIGA